MAVRTPLHEHGSTVHRNAGAKGKSPAAARLIAALNASPRLTDEDAAYLEEVVRVAREESAADELPD
jgi:hypothetical protein